MRPVLLLLVVGACVPKPAVVGPAPLASPVAAIDVSGDWHLGDGAEPDEPVVTVQRPCGETVTRWRVFHAGERIGAVLVSGASLEGTPRELPVMETAWGKVNGDALELESVPGISAPRTAHWSLRYEAEPRRLRGMREGVAVWLAPLVVEEPPDCTDPLTTPVPFSVEGPWLIGSGSPEPAMSRLAEDRNCAHHPATWSLYRRGDRIEAWSFPETFDQGIASTEPVAVRKTPEASGTFSGYELTLEGEVRYRLRYDPESGHLRGTRDGVAVWAVRRQFVPPGPCPGIP